MRTKVAILRVECPDRPGLVHLITGVLYRHGVNVVANHEFVDSASSLFFMRTEFEGRGDLDVIEAEVRKVVGNGGMVCLAPMKPKSVVILASREHHCLADCLVRHAYGQMNANILGVLSNYSLLGDLVSKFQLPFHEVPVPHEDRESHEQALRSHIDAWQPDYLVLAKYMRVLSPAFVAAYRRRIINIHHSFLPAFVGARPYHQAFDRGVKVIGATAHFVTDELDAGPIIVQQVLPVNHQNTAEDFVRAGRDVEQLTLAQALRLVFEDRVFLCGNRTIIFD